MLQYSRESINDLSNSFNFNVQPVEVKAGEQNLGSQPNNGPQNILSSP